MQNPMTNDTEYDDVLRLIVQRIAVEMVDVEAEVIFLVPTLFTPALPSGEHCLSDLPLRRNPTTVEMGPKFTGKPTIPLCLLGLLGLVSARTGAIDAPKIA